MYNPNGETPNTILKSIDFYGKNFYYISNGKDHWFAVNDVCKIIGFETKGQRVYIKKIIKRKYNQHLSVVKQFNLYYNPWHSETVLMILEPAILKLLNDNSILIPVHKTSDVYKFKRSIKTLNPNPPRPIYSIIGNLFQNETLMKDDRIFILKFKEGCDNSWTIKFEGKITVIITDILNSYPLTQLIEEFVIESDNGNIYYY